MKTTIKYIAPWLAAAAIGGAIALAPIASADTNPPCPMAPIPTSHRWGTTNRTTTKPTPRTASSTCRSDTPRAQAVPPSKLQRSARLRPVGDGAELIAGHSALTNAGRSVEETAPR